MMLLADQTQGWWSTDMWFPAGLGFIALLGTCLAAPKLWERFAPSDASKRVGLIGAAVLQWSGVLLLSLLLIAAYLGQPGVVLQILTIFGITLYLIGYSELRTRTIREATAMRRSEAQAIRLGH